MYNIYDAGTLTPIVDFNAIISLDLRHSSQVLNYPAEQGAFTSVNKIQKPLEITVEAVKTGDESEIARAVSKLVKYRKSTALVSVSTPYGAYLNMNMTELSYKHSQTSGAYMLEAHMSFQEIRQTALKYSKITPKDVNHASNQDRGLVQPKQPESVLYSTSKKLGQL